MEQEKVCQMPLSRVYPLLVNKAVRKGRTAEEVAQAVQWLTGWTAPQVETLMAQGMCYGDFFRQAPAMNPARTAIRGSVCGVRVEEVAEPLMQDIRRLDKLIDGLAKGKPLEKLLPENK